MEIKIAPSIASGPLTNLKDSIQELDRAGASMIHFDIEDGNFVPVMNIGMKVIKELRPLSKLPFDVHLMVQDPEWLIPELAAMGVNHVSVHYEACPYPRRTLRLISEAGMRAGLAFNPKTPIPDLAFCLPYLSFVVILTTEPEHQDCPFLPDVLKKISQAMLQEGLEGITWVADGGITKDNVVQVVNSGADQLVIGRGIYQDGRIKENIDEIRALIDESLPGA